MFLSIDSDEKESLKDVTYSNHYYEPKCLVATIFITITLTTRVLSEKEKNIRRIFESFLKVSTNFGRTTPFI